MLVLPHQPRRVVFNRKNQHGLVRDGFGGLQDVQAHGVARCLVQDQGEAIELHHLMEPAGQLGEQRGQIAVQDNRFRNGQQGSVPGRQWQLPARRRDRLSWRKPWSVTNPEPAGGQPLRVFVGACTKRILPFIQAIGQDVARFGRHTDIFRLSCLLSGADGLRPG